MSESDYSLFWKETIKQLRDEKEITLQEYNMWFGNMSYLSSTDSSIIVSVPSKFYKDQVKQRYITTIEHKILELSGNSISIQFEIQKIITKNKKQSNNDKADFPSPEVEKEALKVEIHPQLRRNYTFSSFVVGNNNSFAANAAQAISNSPGTNYNPCLIYGGVGLGKTHLMQAIGNSIYLNNPEKKIVYIPAETFLYEFVEAIGKKHTPQFKAKYRKVDVLLIDDIHDLQNKKETQEELFHTFNHLYDANKQMVFTCDRPPSELKNFTDRLLSRFVRGLNVDLQPPNYETRMAILNKKMDNINVSIPPEVIELMSKNITTNIRDLEAALLRISSYAELVQKDITIDLAQQQLKQFFAGPVQSNVTIDRVQRVVSDYFNVSTGDLKGKKRTKIITYPRQIAMFIIRDLTDYSTTEIGLEFGGRDHTTVMHSCQRIEDRMKTDSTLEPLIQNLIRAIKEYGNT